MVVISVFCSGQLELLACSLLPLFQSIFLHLQNLHLVSKKVEMGAQMFPVLLYSHAMLATVKFELFIVEWLACIS